MPPLKYGPHETLSSSEHTLLCICSGCCTSEGVMTQGGVLKESDAVVRCLKTVNEDMWKRLHSSPWSKDSVMEYDIFFKYYRLDARYWMLGAGALGRPRGMVWGGWREEGSGWGAHVYLWWIRFDVWQN